MTNHTDISTHEEMERVRISILEGCGIEARTTKAPRDRGIILAAVVHIRELSDRNLAV
jgi:hypothetical protein